MTRQEWLAERYRIPGVGASDAANLLGVGFGTALGVYRDKVSPPPPDAPATGRLRRGLDLEPVIARRYAEVMGVDVLPPVEAVARHPDREWQFCSPDLMRADGRSVQMKSCAGFGDDWGAGGTDHIPDGYTVQVQAEMGVMGLDWCDLAALDVIEWELRVYRVRFNAAFFGWLTEIEQRFMADHLLPRVPPGDDWQDQFARPALAMIRPVAVDLGDAGAALAERRARVAEVRKDAEAEYDRLTAELRGLMGDAERATAGVYTVKRSMVAGSTYTVNREPYESLRVTRRR